MSEITIKPPTAVPIKVTPAPGLPVEVKIVPTPATRVVGVAGIPGPPGKDGDVLDPDFIIDGGNF